MIEKEEAFANHNKGGTKGNNTKGKKDLNAAGGVGLGVAVGREPSGSPPKHVQRLMSPIKRNYQIINK